MPNLYNQCRASLVQPLQGHWHQRLVVIHAAHHIERRDGHPAARLVGHAEQHACAHAGVRYRHMRQ